MPTTGTRKNQRIAAAMRQKSHGVAPSVVGTVNSIASRRGKDNAKGTCPFHSTNRSNQLGFVTSTRISHYSKEKREALCYG